MATFNIWINTLYKNQKIDAETEEEAKKIALENASMVIDSCDMVCGTCDGMVDEDGCAYNSGCTYGDDYCDGCGRCHCNQAC